MLSVLPIYSRHFALVCLTSQRAQMTVRRSSRLLAKASVSSSDSSTPTSFTEAASAKKPKTKTTSTGKITKNARNGNSNKIKKKTATAAKSSSKKQEPTKVTTDTNSKNKTIQSTLSSPGAMKTALEHLRSADPKLGELIDRTKEQCKMSLSRTEQDDSSYTSLCKSIIYQQVAGKAAASIMLRFVKKYGTLRDESKAHLLDEDKSELTSQDFHFPSAQYVSELAVDEMRQAGLSQRKAEYIKEIATRFSSGALSEEMFFTMPDEEVIQKLVAIRGIGPWTVDMFLMFHLKRPNVLPTLDLAIRKAMCKHFGVTFGKNTPKHDELVELAKIWEPYRSVATWYMWRLTDTVTVES